MKKVNISSLSQFKKALAVGVKVHCIHAKTGDMGIRPVARVQSNAFTLSTEINGETKESWCHFPKASECTFESGSIVINWEVGGKLQPILTYSILEQ